jgi:hypothetical protein
MADKPHVTRTYAAIHFEDLEPHRFEDLVRNLLYDFRDWQTIEPTGRGGNDGGFDTRAWERTQSYDYSIHEPLEGIQDADEPPEPQEATGLMDGNLWQIQCKREKTIGPTRVAAIVANDVDQNNPPHGYILAAPTEFSKDSYDTFRQELAKRGVMEYELWGKARLEEMLYMPKNDRILFAFFGISLVSRRRSRSTQIRTAVINNNKVYRITGGLDEKTFSQNILLRDINDEDYPYEYTDFEKNPRWLEVEAVEHHALGLIVHTGTFYAYVDMNNNQYDILEQVNLLMTQRDHAEFDDNGARELSRIARNFIERMPRKNKRSIKVFRLVRYDDMLVIDDKGDSSYPMPHIFIDFTVHDGPYAGKVVQLTAGINKVDIKEYSRVTMLPKKLPRINYGTFYRSAPIVLNREDFDGFRRGAGVDTIFDTSGKYRYLKVGDLALVVPENGPPLKGKRSIYSR